VGLTVVCALVAGIHLGLAAATQGASRTKFSGPRDQVKIGEMSPIAPDIAGDQRCAEDCGLRDPIVEYR